MRERPTKDVREKFLEASFGYLTENGLDNISLRELGKKTGISLGSVYYWFEGKDGLIISAAEYGLGKVAEQIFDYAFKNMNDMKAFFGSCIEEISKYKMQLRFIYQIATSPIYGEWMRSRADELNCLYESYAEKLSKLLGCSVEEMAPLVYMFNSIILDYVVWDDLEKTKLQLNYIYKLFANLSK